MLAWDHAIAISLYMSVCPADFRPLPKKKEYLIAGYQHATIEADVILWLTSAVDDRLSNVATGILIVIHPVWIYLRMGKKSSFGRWLRRLHPSFRREMVCFFIYSVFVKMNTTLSRPSHFVAKMYTYTCQHLFFFLCLCTKFRDGPLEKLWGGRGIFEPQEFFFVIKFLVWIYFRP